MGNQKILINYADKRFYQAQKKNSATGRDIGGFDRVREYGRADLDPVFANKHHRILDVYRGAGYWIWKPYIILKTLQRSEPGDYIFYCDSGAHFVNSINPLIELIEAGQQPILPFTSRLPERQYTKRDLFLLMKCDQSEYTETPQRIAGFQLIKNGLEAMRFYQEYLEMAQKPQALTNMTNRMGQQNYAGFQEHRHDQSIYSLLTKKYGYQAVRNPSQYGGKGTEEYPQIVELTRDCR